MTINIKIVSINLPSNLFEPTQGSHTPALGCVLESSYVFSWVNIQLNVLSNFVGELSRLNGPCRQQPYYVTLSGLRSLAVTYSPVVDLTLNTYLQWMSNVCITKHTIKFKYLAECLINDMTFTDHTQLDSKLTRNESFEVV